jgi:F-type H+-transporting ATPase subunit delta
MNIGLISRRYAKAMYEYAAEKNDETTLYEHMNTLILILNSIPKIRRIFTNPLLPSKYKKDLLEKATGDNPDKIYLDCINLVLSKNRETLIQNIALEYQSLYRKMKNISVVNLTSATPMKNEILDRIRKQVESKTNGEVEFNANIDASLDGGFIFQLDDMRLDASVKGQLERIRRKLLQ